MKTFILISFLFASLNIRAAERSDLTVLSYNIYTIPCLKNKTPLQKLIVKLFGRKCPVEGHYAQSISARINQFKKYIYDLNNAPDVIFIQEAFSSRSKIFNDKAIKDFKLEGYPYKALGPASHHKRITDFLEGTILRPKLNANGALGSGLIIFSKYPLKDVQMMSFSDCEISDCASVKGALKSTLLHPKLGKITLINTHLQAEDKFDDIRVLQIQEIYNFLQQQNLEEKIVFAGDFNFMLDENRYQSFSDFRYLFYEYQVASLSCQQNPSCRFTDSVDDEHRMGMTWDHAFSMGAIVMRYSTPHWTYQNKPLSDHRPLLIDYDLP